MGRKNAIQRGTTPYGVEYGRVFQFSYQHIVSNGTPIITEVGTFSVTAETVRTANIL
jgi:hypothetical protein